MEDDGDADSQLSVLATSLSWWMMKNLWKQGTSDEKLRLSVVDTFFLKDGHLECWYFTSSKSGSVLKVRKPHGWRNDAAPALSLRSSSVRDRACSWFKPCLIKTSTKHDCAAPVPGSGFLQTHSTVSW